MIGQRIEYRPGFTWGEALTFFAGLAFFAWAVASASPQPAVAAVLPLAIWAALLLTRPVPFSASLTSEGLELGDPPQLIHYAAIEGLTVAGKPTSPRARIYVFHAAGVVIVPPRLNVPSNELYRFLASQVSETGSRDLPAPLMKYLQQQTDLFGDAKVYSYRARPHATPRSRERPVAVCLAMAVTGVAWVFVAIGGGKPYVPWAGVGGMLIVLFTLFAIALALGSKGARIRNWRQSGLVIGPAGLALVQGDTRGEMRWGELRNVEYRHKPRSFRLEGTGAESRVCGIHLVVEGARIVIADIYDRPLPLIYDRIHSYWQGRAANA